MQKRTSQINGKEQNGPDQSENGNQKDDCQKPQAPFTYFSKRPIKSSLRMR